MEFPPIFTSFQNIPARELSEALSRHEIKAEGNCLLWTGAKLSNGSGLIEVSYAGLRRRVAVRRLVYSAFCGSLKHGEYVVNTCNNAACLKPLHLKKSKCTQGIETDETVKLCASLCRAGKSNGEIGCILNISVSWVDKLLKRARAEKLLLPAAVEGIPLNHQEARFFQAQGYDLTAYNINL